MRDGFRASDFATRNKESETRNLHFNNHISQNCRLFTENFHCSNRVCPHRIPTGSSTNGVCPFAALVVYGSVKNSGGVESCGSGANRYWPCRSVESVEEVRSTPNSPNSQLSTPNSQLPIPSLLHSLLPRIPMGKMGSAPRIPPNPYRR